MPEEITLAEGSIERIGKDDAIFNFKNTTKKEKKRLPIHNHELAVDLLMNGLINFGVIDNKVKLLV